MITIAGPSLLSPLEPAPAPPGNGEAFAPVLAALLGPAAPAAVAPAIANQVGPKAMAGLPPSGTALPPGGTALPAAEATALPVAVEANERVGSVVVDNMLVPVAKLTRGVSPGEPMVEEARPVATPAVPELPVLVKRPLRANEPATRPARFASPPLKQATPDAAGAASADPGTAPILVPDALPAPLPEHTPAGAASLKPPVPMDVAPPAQAASQALASPPVDAGLSRPAERSSLPVSTDTAQPASAAPRPRIDAPTLPVVDPRLVPATGSKPAADGLKTATDTSLPLASGLEARPLPAPAEPDDRMAPARNKVPEALAPPAAPLDQQQPDPTRAASERKGATPAVSVVEKPWLDTLAGRSGDPARPSQGFAATVPVQTDLPGLSDVASLVATPAAPRSFEAAATLGLPVQAASALAGSTPLPAMSARTVTPETTLSTQPTPAAGAHSSGPAPAASASPAAPVASMIAGAPVPMPIVSAATVPVSSPAAPTAVASAPAVPTITAAPAGRAVVSPHAARALRPGPVVDAVAAPVIRPALQAFGAALHRAAVAERRPVAVGSEPVLALAPATAIAAPVANPAPLDMTQQRWPEAMIARVEQVRDLQNAGDTRIRLHPDALGHIDVALRRDGEAVHVHFTAAEPATARLIAEAQPRLAELADARGLKLATDAGGANTGSDRRQPAQPQSAAPSRPTSARAAGDDPTDTRLA